MKLKVITPGKMVVVNNKPSRSPVVIDIANEEQLNYYEMICRSQSLEYEIVDDESDNFEKPEMILDNSDEKEPVIEELKTGRLLDELTK